MKRTWTTALLVLTLALMAAACDTGSDEGTTTTAPSGTTTTVDGEELSALLVDARAQALNLATDIEAMTDSADLQQAWADLMADLDTLAADVASGDSDALRQSLDEVGTMIDGASDEAAASVRPAWEEFRTTMEDVLSELQM
ncbi:MAG TPA: hypothetical protein VLA29_10635 [Acidimicrobiia bacterium]|nr:hypothetical protein [Acidimicrobiia bacterium]